MKENVVRSIVLGCSCILAVNFYSFSQNEDRQAEVRTGHTGDASNVHTQGNSQMDLQEESNRTPQTSESIPMDLSSVMQNNVTEMLALNMTGRLDLDFARMMAHHYKGGLHMSEVYLQSAQNQELKQIAQQMINQRKEREKLLTFVKKNEQQNKHAEANTALVEPLQQLMKEINNIGLAGGIDQQFATLMIQHHKAGVEMAEVEISNGTHAEMKEIARTIKEEKKKAIGSLQRWLDSNK